MILRVKKRKLAGKLAGKLVGKLVHRVRMMVPRKVRMITKKRIMRKKTIKRRTKMSLMHLMKLVTVKVVMRMRVRERVRMRMKQLLLHQRRLLTPNFPRRKMRPQFLVPNPVRSPRRSLLRHQSQLSHRKCLHVLKR